MRRETFPWARYVTAAAALGLVWFGVLHLARLPREFLAASGRVRGALLLILASVLVALTLRRWIAHAEHDVRMTLVGPYWGTLLFAVGSAATTWVAQGFRALNYTDLFLLLPLWALLTSLWLFWLVLPMGYLCQRVMRWAAGAGDRWD
jgi:hypothetical protein